MFFGNHACWQEMDGLVGVSVMQHKKTKTNGGTWLYMHVEFPLSLLKVKTLSFIL